MCFRCESTTVARRLRSSRRSDLLRDPSRASRDKLFLSVFRLCLSVAVIIFALNAEAQTNRILRVAADPNNLPFSNIRGEGFENKIAELLARELNAKLEYTWRAQRRGFFRETLKSGDCDITLGAPADFEMAATTRAYYRSSYVFVSRKDRHLDIESLDDPQLRRLKIGVQLAGDVGGNPPPLQALAARNIFTNVIGFSVFGNYSEPNPPARIIDAVARGDVDVAIAWGALAGYFAKKESTPLTIVPVTPSADTNGLPMSFSICIGVKRGEKELRNQLNEILARGRADIQKILGAYNVPQLPLVQTVKAN
jgi:mxaJ protein